MEETVVYPSPNWFLPSILAVSKDGWVIYGGPSKSLVVLEPLSPDFEGVLDSDHRYKTHMIPKCHTEKVAVVDISPDWAEKKQFVTTSSDGIVKEWLISELDNQWVIKNTYSHEAHVLEKEEAVGVGYSMSNYIISVGSFSNIVTWERSTSITKTHNSFMRSFRATCMSCSPHLPLVVAVGTKQGVLFVLDLNDRANIVYKVRAHDEEIAHVAWCPQFEVILKKALMEIKKSYVTQRLEQIRNEKEPTDSDTSSIDMKLPEVKKSNVTQRLEQIRNEKVPSDFDASGIDKKDQICNEQEPADPDASGIDKKLPEDSFDESTIVQEDDTFDIYKDHEADEFGHKKYEPENIYVKKKDDAKKDDFLAECERLKAQILKNKEETEESIETLVEAMDKAHVEDPTERKTFEKVAESVIGAASLGASGTRAVPVDASFHIHKHLLASISKNGYNVRIWSKSGKVVASCTLSVLLQKNGKQYQNKSPFNASICWYKPDCLMFVDGRTNLVQCNPLQIDCKNKLIWSVVHSVHRRGTYFIGSNAPRVQTLVTLADPHCEDEWVVWTAAQDRYLIKYDMKARKVLAKLATSGGHLYDVSPCSYDAGKLAIGVGDGTIRVWQTQTSGAEENKLTLGEVTSYWQNVQGKILQVAWHPTKENLLAFSTAESRVGTLDISKPDRPAKLLQVALTQGVYSMVWGDKMTLFAVGSKELVMYQANKPELAAVPINIEIEGQVWAPSVVNHSSRGLAVSSCAGGVSLFTGAGGHALAAKIVFAHKIHAMVWHPLQTSNSDEESKYKNLMAVASVCKSNVIVILQYEDKEGGGKQFSNFTTLTGHTDVTLQLYWNPHREGLLLSTSHDGTVRIWDAIQGACVSVFDGHSGATMGAAWCAQPQLDNKVLSGGNDYCLRLWDINDYPAENFAEKKEPRRRKRHFNPVCRKTLAQVAVDKNEADDDDDDAEPNENKQSHEEPKNDPETVKDTTVPKKYLLPMITRQISRKNKKGPFYALQQYTANYNEIKDIREITKLEDVEHYYMNYLKLFGNINELNEVLDVECKGHLNLKGYREYSMLMIFRGRIDTVIQYAYEHDFLDSFLLSIAPCVSNKYWKDAVQLYLAQSDRYATRKTQEQIENAEGIKVGKHHTSTYGGAVFRKVAVLLSIHDVKGAVDVLEKLYLFKEAYVLCRCRHMDSVAQEILHKWAAHLALSGDLILSAFLYVVIGNNAQAVHVLRRSNEMKFLNLGAEIAKVAGLNTCADFIENKVKEKNAEKQLAAANSTEENLAKLPEKMELLMKDVKVQNGESNNEKLTSEEQTELEELPKQIELLGKENKIQNGESMVEQNGAGENDEVTESKV